MSACTLRDGWLIAPREISEATSFPPPDALPAVLKFDLSELKSLNSYGLRNLLDFLRHNASRPLEFHNCPVIFVEMMGIVHGLRGPSANPAVVQSIAIPYQCDDCNKFIDSVAQTSTLDLADANYGQPPLPCDACGRPMAIDPDWAGNLGFLAK